MANDGGFRGQGKRRQVQCPNCAADVPVLREFCPNCGSPMDPAIRERRRDAREPRGAQGGRSDEELHANRKKFLIGGAALLVVLAAMGKIGLHGVPIHIDVDHGRKGPAVVEAQQVYDAYRDDPGSAAKRFAGREMVVSGEFLRLVPDGYGSLDMRLKTSNPEAPLGADLAGIAVEDAKQLRPGQRVTVSCKRMAGGGDDPWMQDCAIQPAPDSSSAPSAPREPPAPEAPPPPPAPPPR